MISNILAVAASVPATPVEWSPKIAAIISASSLVALLLALKVKKPLEGPKMPLLPISVPAFVGAMCFGHILGIGIILGLTNTGRL